MPVELRQLGYLQLHHGALTEAMGCHVREPDVAARYRSGC